MVRSIADVTPNGSAKTLAASRTPACWCIISAPSGNTGDIRVGDSQVSATRGAVLSKGLNLTLLPIGDAKYLDLAQVSIFGAAGADKVGVIYGTS